MELAQEKVREKEPPKPEKEEESFTQLESDSEPDSPKPLVDQKTLANARGELRKHFEIAEEDELVTYYYCALEKKLPYNGWLYICKEVLYFRSKLPKLKKEIHLQNVIAIERKSSKFLPTAIQIDLVSGEQYFFSNFRKRDETYDILMDQWEFLKNGDSKGSKEEKETPVHKEEGSEASDTETEKTKEAEAKKKNLMRDKSGSTMNHYLREKELKLAVVAQ